MCWALAGGIAHTLDGDRGTGGQETGRKGGWEVGFPRWQEAGEKGKNYATLHNILQLKKCRGGANKYRAVTGIKGYRKQEIYTLFPPPHTTP